MAETLKDQLIASMTAAGKSPTPSRLAEGEKLVADGIGIARTADAHSVRGLVLNWMTEVVRTSATDFRMSCRCADWVQRGSGQGQPCAHIWALSIEQPPLADPHAAFVVSLAPQQGTGFQAEVRHTIGKTIAKLASQILRVIEDGQIPLVLGPTGTGKTSAVRMVAEDRDWGYEEVAGSPSIVEADLIGLRLKDRDVPGVLARAFARARELHAQGLEGKVVVMIDEFNRLNPRAQDGLMRPFLPTARDVARRMNLTLNGELVDCDVTLVEGPLWGQDLAPWERIVYVAAANPWGNELDVALLRRVFPIYADFDNEVANKFEPRLAEIIKGTWAMVREGQVGLPLEYGILATAKSANDTQILARYYARLRAESEDQARAWEAQVTARGLTIPRFGH